MPASTFVIVPPGSPFLEAIAGAIQKGVTEAGGTELVPLVVGGSPEGLAAASDAPLVFLGWRSDTEESRRLGQRILTEIGGPTPNSRHVALFEVVVRGPTPSLTVVHPGAGPMEEPNMLPLVPSERFYLEHRADGDSVGPLEMARARHWAAQAWTKWRSARAPSPSTSSSEDSRVATARTVPWCGAME